MRQRLKEHRLYSRQAVLLHHLRLDDVELAGSGLANGATLCLFDDSPFHPNGNALFDYATKEQFAIFVTTTKYTDAVRRGGFTPVGLDLRAMQITNDPLGRSFRGAIGSPAPRSRKR